MAGKAGRLKVFQAQFGFYDSVVAATSQAAALRAWGTHQNLFAEGQARVTTDAAAMVAALAHPEVPLRRAVGSAGAFELEPTTRPDVPDLPNLPRRSARAAPPPQAAKSRPDRSKLDAAERALAELDRDRKEEERGFEVRRSELEAEIAAARAIYLDRRKAAKAGLAAARDAYRKAGGT